MNRREFFKTASVAGAAGLTGGVAASSARGSERIEPWDELMGVLVDIPRCIGCRRCEFACQQAADFKNFEVPAQESFDDKSVFAEQRRPQPREHTVINRYANPADESRPLYNKVNCLHCIDPACLSACLVTAFSKRPDGPVVYDPWRCMGCRYCMVACPFEIPTYDYDMPLAPRVRKCNLCAHIVPGEQEVPACVKMCPEEVMTYGPRKELLALARERIRSAPDKYVDHIYGEHEGGRHELAVPVVRAVRAGGDGRRARAVDAPAGGGDSARNLQVLRAPGRVGRPIGHRDVHDQTGEVPGRRRGEGPRLTTTAGRAFSVGRATTAGSSGICIRTRYPPRFPGPW